MFAALKLILLTFVILCCFQFITMARLPRDDTAAVASSSDDNKLDLPELASKLVEELKKTLNNEDLQNLWKAASDNIQEVGKKVSESVANALNNLKTELPQQ